MSWAKVTVCQELRHLPYFEDLVADTVKNVIDRIPPGGSLSNSAHALSVHAHAQCLSTHFKESLSWFLLNYSISTILVANHIVHFFLIFNSVCILLYGHKVYFVLSYDDLSRYASVFKGTVSRDFLLLVLFMNQFAPSPRVFH